MIEKLNFKLGGWHRLWIVLSVLYLIFVVAFFYDAFPKKPSDIYPDKVIALMKPDEGQYVVGAWLYDPNLPDTDGERTIKIVGDNHFIKLRLPVSLRDQEGKPSTPSREAILAELERRKSKNYSSDREELNALRRMAELENEGAQSVQKPNLTQTPKLVTDPAILAQLNSEQPVAKTVFRGTFIVDPNDPYAKFSDPVNPLKKFIQETAIEYHKALLIALKQQRMSVVLNGFLAWISPIIALYLFSWSVGWVFRGFKNAKI